MSHRNEWTIWVGLTLVVVVVLIVGGAHAKYDFDDAFYNEQLLDQVDDAIRPWRSEKDDGHDRRQRPRYRHKGGVLVARWYPARRGDAPQYQWNWEVPPGVNQSTKMWYRSYYPNYYRPYRRRYYCGYRGYYRYCYGRGYSNGRGYYGNGRGNYGNGRDYYGNGRGYYGNGRGDYGNGRGDYGNGRGDYGGGGYYGQGYGRPNGYRGVGGGYGPRIGFGGYASWSGGPMFGRIVVNSKERADAPAHATTSTSTPASSASAKDPNTDVEQVSISNNIESLPTATEDMLVAVDENPGYIPFQEQVCCGKYEEARLLRQDAIREQCFQRVFNDSQVHEDEMTSWNQFHCSSVQAVKNKVQCVHRCIWRLRGTMEEEKVSISKLRGFYQFSESEGWRRNIMDKAAEKCISSYDADLSDVSDEDRSTCPNTHLGLSYCLWEELQANCPDDEWNSKSQYCTKLRSHIRKRRGNSS